MPASLGGQERMNRLCDHRTLARGKGLDGPTGPDVAKHGDHGAWNRKRTRVRRCRSGANEPLSSTSRHPSILRVSGAPPIMSNALPTVWVGAPGV
jgi:hypothetical protein